MWFLNHKFKQNDLVVLASLIGLLIYTRKMIRPGNFSRFLFKCKFTGINEVNDFFRVSDNLQVLFAFWYFATLLDFNWHHKCTTLLLKARLLVGGASRKLFLLPDTYILMHCTLLLCSTFSLWIRQQKKTFLAKTQLCKGLTQIVFFLII